MYRSGILKPRLKTADHGAVDMFAPEDLDAFLGRLLDGAPPVKAAASLADMPSAAKKACYRPPRSFRRFSTGA
ncbi:hypothetical protein [Bradyrhizobium mercantei]|uniref:hypothetical protein n=1 Tax=Bradyrhizobium mercantei TaxID=1904807 RepID=UPI001177C94E|nr:hypothetical protein [Bradyrhizobium mercantei]